MIAQQQAEIAALQVEFPEIKIFSGIEADILADGRLDYDSETLRAFDFVIGSIHSRHGQDAAATTQRLIRALSDPHLTMIGHLSGRLLLAREAAAFDVDAVLEAAAAHGKAIELNANPHRLDLDWRLLRRARALGISLMINPDAHSVEGLDDVRWGVAMARKAALGPADVWNNLSPEVLAAKLAS
jgi:DNA polymerase (family 10)